MVISLVTFLRWSHLQTEFHQPLHMQEKDHTNYFHSCRSPATSTEPLYLICSCLQHFVAIDQWKEQGVGQPTPQVETQSSKGIRTLSVSLKPRIGDQYARKIAQTRWDYTLYGQFLLKRLLEIIASMHRPQTYFFLDRPFKICFVCFLKNHVVPKAMTVEKHHEDAAGT